MEDLRTLDYALYQAIYEDNNPVTTEMVWDKIKSNKRILQEAIKVKQNKWKENTLESLTIADRILIDYENVDKEIYQELINLIYSNQDIANSAGTRVGRDRITFLLASLYNENLKLTPEQKEFATKEALTQNGAIHDGTSKYLGHGHGAFDIRFHILRNDNWTLEEKRQLVKDFWTNDVVYDDCLEEWEWSIVNDAVNYRNNPLSVLDKTLLYEYSYEDLLKLYEDKETTDYIWKQIEFCRQMHELRPQTWERKSLAV